MLIAALLSEYVCTFVESLVILCFYIVYTHAGAYTQSSFTLLLYLYVLCSFDAPFYVTLCVDLLYERVFSLLITICRNTNINISAEYIQDKHDHLHIFT